MSGDPTAGAIISECGRYRYRLWRRWAPGRVVLWCMLNPSTADGLTDDPTIRKCIGFAERWSFGAIEVINLFAWRATDPRRLPRDPDTKIGPDNHFHMVTAAPQASIIVAAWGAHAPMVRAEEVMRELLWMGPVYHLGMTASGQPRHPLMLPYKQPLMEVPR